MLDPNIKDALQFSRKAIFKLILSFIPLFLLQIAFYENIFVFIIADLFILFFLGKYYFSCLKINENDSEEDLFTACQQLKYILIIYALPAILFFVVIASFLLIGLFSTLIH